MNLIVITSNISISLEPRRKGRPLSFDRAAALHQAMLLFWKHGYESTSLNDLTAALGVKPSSIYSVFGDKKRLFLEAVSLYTSGPVTADSIIEQASTAREAAQDLLTASVLGFTGDDTPKGCLLATSAISCSEGAEDIQAQLAAIRIGIETRLRNKINADVDAGRMPDGVDSEALAAHVLAVIQGLSTLARDGAQREKLLRLATVAMASWPGNPGG